MCVHACCRFHLLKPEYVHHRIKELQRSFRLRLLICHIDVEDVVEPLAQVIKAALLNEVTLICGWSPEVMPSEWLPVHVLISLVVCQQVVQVGAAGKLVAYQLKHHGRCWSNLGVAMLALLNVIYIAIACLTAVVKLHATKLKLACS